ncbi:hypothetical protein GCM10022247_17790 [Allokutzneria multivorans]|uniref:Uncharacterized protein n=1 Tax=Allokutzneria multivorans TaxID=1142134 RepID=A0ABP7RIH7_9PSEU
MAVEVAVEAVAAEVRVKAEASAYPTHAVTAEPYPNRAHDGHRPDRAVAVRSRGRRMTHSVLTYDPAGVQQP